MTVEPPTTNQGARRHRAHLSRGEQMLLVVLALAALHQVDHVLRADNSGWPFTPDVTPFTISFIIYPLMALDFGYLRNRPWPRVTLIAVLFVALQVVHLVYEPPGAQYGTWANGVSDMPHAFGRPNLLGVAAPALGVASVTVSTLLSAAVLLTLVLLIREASATPSSHTPPPATDRDAQSQRQGSRQTPGGHRVDRHLLEAVLLSARRSSRADAGQRPRSQDGARAQDRCRRRRVAS